MMQRAVMVLISAFPLFFAGACWFGAMFPLSAPMWCGVGILCCAFGVRNRLLLVVAGFLAAAVFSSNAIGGLQPLTSQTFVGTVVFVRDPQYFPGRMVADVKTNEGRMQLSASGSVESRLRDSTAGTHVVVSGSLRKLSHPERFRSRHLRMSLVVSDVIGSDWRSLWSIPIDFVRSVVENGASALPIEQQAVYKGFVIGDDRGSDQEVTQEFEDSGLSHLLVVSGQNVVFVLAVITPLTRGLGRRSRTAVLFAVLLLFAAVTRFEPSILRATAMALIALVGTNSGRSLGALSRLAIAVSLLVLLDPLLVHSFGFRLSVAATAGIALFSQAIADRLRGPGWFRQVLSVTIAAQVAVAPFIVPLFGPMPLASLPANVLAEPVAGLVMMWGSSVGLLAGVLGGWPAVVLQAPVRIGVWWIMLIADRCSQLPLPRIGLTPLVLACVAVVGRRAVQRGWTVRRLRQ